MDILGERAFWLAWSQVPGVGAVLLQRLEEHFGTLGAAWSASKTELGQVEGFGYHTLAKVETARKQMHPAELLSQHLLKNPTFWTPSDADYPRLLREIPSPPPVLYYRGEVDLQENLGTKGLVGIVGTRKPSEYGIRWTRKISTALAQHGFTIVSGLADGIDTESHTACLKAGGRTLAVLGTGVDVIYPQKNRELYKQILPQGLVLSEYRAKTPPDRSHFPARNRIIAGLSRAVLVMEAPTRSGALITARYANEFGRDVYALPGRLDDISFQGCLKLLSQGASTIVTEIDELLQMLGAIPQLDLCAPPSPVLPLSLPPDLQPVMNTLLIESLPFDLIVQQSGLTTAATSSALLQLELMGLVTQLPGMRYRRVDCETFN